MPVDKFGRNTRTAAGVSASASVALPQAAKIPIGLIPSLTQNVGLFTASASSENDGKQAWKAFNHLPGTLWATNIEALDYWLRIDLPIPVRVWAFSLAGGPGRPRAPATSMTDQPFSWRLEGSNNGRNWTPLHTEENAPLDEVLRFYEVSRTHIPFRSFRLFVLTSTANSVSGGLSHFQLYPLAELY